MSVEKVEPKLLPYDLRLRLVMGSASEVLSMRRHRLFPPERDRLRIKTASEMLSPTQPEDDDNHISGKLREYRLIERAWEAVGAPGNATENNIRALLGAASVTLGNLAEGKLETEDNIEFAEAIVSGIHEVAAARRAQPTETVIL